MLSKVECHLHKNDTQDYDLTMSARGEVQSNIKEVRGQIPAGRHVPIHVGMKWNY